MKKQTVVISMFFFALLVGFVSCGDNTMGFKETFKADDTVENSLFSFSAWQQVGNLEGDYKLLLVSDGVSSAFVKLNDEELFSPDDFHNTYYEKTIDVDVEETNTIEAEIRGSPGDQLCVRIFEVLEDETERGVFEQCVDREAGPPNVME
jgi:hypothetical protein